jgi:hypothetical protein
MKIQITTALVGVALGVGGTLVFGSVAGPSAGTNPAAGAAVSAPGAARGGQRGTMLEGRRIQLLQGQVDAMRSDRDRLAAELAQKKGVTLATIKERLAKIKKSPGLLMGIPGDLSGLINDLRGLGPEGIREVMTMLASEDPADRILATQLLGSLNTPDAVPSLLDRALNDDHRMAGISASHALAMMDDPSTVGALHELAERKTTVEAQINALYGLAKQGDSRGIEAAMAFINDPKIDMAARGALAANVMMLPTDTVMPIVDASLTQFPNVPQLTSVAVEYYKTVGTPAALDRLLALASETNSCASCRTAARNALENRGRK